MSDDKKPEPPAAGERSADEAMSKLRSALAQAGDLLHAMESRIAAAPTEEAEDLSTKLAARVAALEAEERELTERLVDSENQNERLMNLYVTTYQLHATLDPVEVQNTIAEIATNLIGAERFALLLRQEDGGPYTVALKRGLSDDVAGPYLGPLYPGGDPLADATLVDGTLRIGPSSGTLGVTAGSDAGDGSTDGGSDGALTFARPFARSLAAVPLVVEGNTVGALVIFKLFAHKTALRPDDRELLDLIAAHAASALMTAELHSQVGKKVRNLEGLVSLSGKLEDVSVADVLQFIHLGGRSGTLSLDDAGAHAEIGFHRGRIVSAIGPGSMRLGDLLVDRGIVTQRQLDRALARQTETHPPEALGQALVSTGAIGPAAMLEAVEQQIEQVVHQLVSWERGNFRFTMGDLRVVDDLAMSPADLLPHINLNIQMVLLEATRLFDERNRLGPMEREVARASDAAPADRTSPDRELDRDLDRELDFGGSNPSAPAPDPAGDPIEAAARNTANDAAKNIARDMDGADAGDELDITVDAPPIEGAGEGAGAGDAATDEALAAAGPAQAAEVEVEVESDPPAPVEPRRAEARAVAARLDVVSSDSRLTDALAAAMRGPSTQVTRVSLHSAGAARPGERPPVVLLDCRTRGLPLSAITTLRRTRPRVPILALVDGGAHTVEAYRAGALSAVPDNVAAIVACFESAAQTVFSQAPVAAPAPFASAADTAFRKVDGFARLRRTFGDLRSSLRSATVSLNLLNVISESVERAVLFIVRRDGLVALGAFGNTTDGVPLAECTRGYRVEPDRAAAILARFADGRAHAVALDHELFPAAFSSLIGRPAADRCAMFPILGGIRVIAVIYADNGQNPLPIEELEILELATSQLGIAYENELILGEGAVPSFEFSDELPDDEAGRDQTAE